MSIFSTYGEAADAIKTWFGPMKKIHEGDDFANEFIDAADFMTKSYVRENVIKGIVSEEWRDCNKSLPHVECGESDEVLTFSENGLIRILYFDGGCWCHPTGEIFTRSRVTHWMPLPDGPNMYGVSDRCGGEEMK